MALTWPRTLRIDVQPPLVGNDWKVTAVTKDSPRAVPRVDVYTRLSEAEAMDLCVMLSGADADPFP